MSGVEHYAEAERLLDLVEQCDWQEESERERFFLTTALSAAQAHATLAAVPEPAEAPRVVKVEPDDELGGCARCPRRWGAGWIDLWVPDEVWQRIAPVPNGQVDGSGHLCANCIVGALAALGLTDVPFEVYAAPLRQPAHESGIQAALYPTAHCGFDMGEGDRCLLPVNHEGQHS
ncbi:hypothetical protein [Nocardioides alkalitolerans]|uniref:hypothetical protein n=1 Tax=Nocardioides alkalitolerans TaxID=281714 RepID=UPI0003FB5BD0|nr:hypothetical protein [Nocardioides alkalitolerans]